MNQREKRLRTLYEESNVNNLDTLDKIAKKCATLFPYVTKKTRLDYTKEILRLIRQQKAGIAK